jgi:beta-galactosidase
MSIFMKLLVCTTLLLPLWQGVFLRGQGVPEPNLVFIDASKPVPAPETGFVDLGSATNPAGGTIGINSRYLTLNGKPWFPVMGEFHYVRYPEQYWEEEILKMKAAGIQIVATYVIWIYHEEVEGRFNWSKRRDLRAFVQLCHKHGLYVLVRVGPWSHAETRNGGFPDWLLKKTRQTRSNDPVYLESVQRYFAQIAQQLNGLYWKNGGPVIGIQLENEYTMRGAGRGNEHILKLKQMARASGMDVPLYTVTGWDGAAIPPHEVVPVFGGYPDAPWDSAMTKLPPNEVYLFRFANRVSGDMGGQGPRSVNTSQEALAHYPFLAAEYGGGLQVTYHRRPVLEPDDLAAMLPVQIGSGINLYGYYMFQGGADLMGSLTTLQESQVSGSATDVPVISYDFQAPLGEYGQERQSLRYLKIFNYFLNDFGDILAPTVTAEPSVVPRGAADFSVPRVAARTNGDLGFIFVNNYVRDYQMPPRPNFQVVLKLPAETVSVPQTPVTIPSGAYFIWPVNIDLAGTRLKYATAQLMAKTKISNDNYFFFVATAGVAAEFSFDDDALQDLKISAGAVNRSGSRLQVLQPGADAALSFAQKNGARVFVIVLTQDQAKNFWRSTPEDHSRALITSSDVYFDTDRIYLRSRGESHFDLKTLPALSKPLNGALHVTKGGGTFTSYQASYPERSVQVAYEKTRDAKAAPPVMLGKVLPWRRQPVAEAPSDAIFQAHAAEWSLKVGRWNMRHVSDVYLDIRYVGDEARLYSKSALLDDDFYDGLPWEIGLKRFEPEKEGGLLKLGILPLRSDAPIYLPERFRPAIKTDGQVAEVEGITAIPEYQLVIQP